ncbi:MAG: hypothetical protein QOG10_4335 [Kribbellaceae bacterium]|jgi:hypothetical protein|nr:hypothetical protein [Kribbellaceae bacterium]
MAVSGAELFARYAYPPNQLGYCGPDDASVLLRRGSPTAELQIAGHARQFEGAWPYLQIIAAAAQIADPLDIRVVEAYWIGNELLDDVDPESAVAQLQDRFGGQVGASWVPGRPHHSFHVFAVYPWVGLLSRDPGHGVALSVLEQCRIRWGEVVAVEGERVRVRSRPLVVRQGLLELGSPREEIAAWSVDGSSPLLSAPRGDQLQPVAEGDQVALHWGWVCDVLGSRQVAELEARSADQLSRTNAGLRAAAGRQ